MLWILYNDNDMKTKVQFLYHQRNDEVFAYFPEENFDKAGKYKSSYDHIGQHGACDPKYASECAKATEEQAEPLRLELIEIGYKLEIV